MTPVPVPEIVNDAVELTRLMADDAEVTVRMGVDPASDTVISADRQRLLQVLLNLLSNAVKYNHRGGRVDVTCHESAPGRVRCGTCPGRARLCSHDEAMTLRDVRFGPG